MSRGLNAIKVIADLETETKGDFTMTTVRIDKAVYTDAENIADVDLETFRTETHNVSARYIIGAENEAELHRLVEIATDSAESRLNPDVAESVKRARKTLAVARSARRDFLSSVELAVTEAAIDLQDVLDVLSGAYADIITELEYAGIVVKVPDTDLKKQVESNTS